MLYNVFVRTSKNNGGQTMFQPIMDILQDFRDCFKRNKTWRWFVVLIVGFMVRNSHKGITSILSSLRLEPKLYHTMLHFFRSKGYTGKDLYDRWIKTAMKRSNIVRIANRVVLLGDHIKIPKEGRRMPDIQTLHQDSQNSGKPEYIAGHNYGHVSAVITNEVTSRSLPLMTELQVSPPRQAGTKKPDGETLVTQMVNLVYRTAQSIGELVIVALDAYFSSKAAWAAADQTIENGERRVEIVTRAQTNTVAFMPAQPPSVRKRGQPRKYGGKVVLYGLFTNTTSFTQTKMTLYGKKAKVKYQCYDLLWRPVKQLVRFVVVEADVGKCVLMSTNLTLTAEQIITIYTLRFKIESSFNEQKNDMGCFAYHFWTNALPKFKKWKKIEPPSETSEQLRIQNTRNAMESYVCLSTIATGLLTVIAFSHSYLIWNSFAGWVRTLRSTIPSVSMTKETFAQDLPLFLEQFPDSPLSQIIIPHRRRIDSLYRFVA
jgi:hypothetical protein